ncbi:25S rRNA (uridine-N(3))-methyltransferase [Smittium mucronatum]|uniref:25S rRNA (Uridine-N(3))-methyltransferase n=1 Tax=Smittium mucronatum TaxID=133383 RepID=A0A1R0H898_9FUNG|nr:25S rRNA (uridine-N(3))-methyltransferase [Smittium mucronatum]
MVKTKKTTLKDRLKKHLDNTSKIVKREAQAKKSEKEISKKKKHTQVHFKSPLYSIKDKILLLGEGNFSFARSLAQKLGSGKNILATCLDSEKDLFTKYEDSAGITDKDRNVRANQDLLVNLFLSSSQLLTSSNLPRAKKSNPKKLSKKRKSLDNDSDSDNETFESQLDPNQDEYGLDLDSSINAQPVDMNVDGQVLVTLKSGEPYDSWNIRSISKKTGMSIQTTVPFIAKDYPGYEHRRTLGFKNGLSVGQNSEILKKSPKTYIFVKRISDEN